MLLCLQGSRWFSGGGFDAGSGSRGKRWEGQQEQGEVLGGGTCKEQQRRF